MIRAVVCNDSLYLLRGLTLPVVGQRSIHSPVYRSDLIHPQPEVIRATTRDDSPYMCRVDVCPCGRRTGRR